METVFQVTALCVTGALLALVVKRGSPESAMLLTLGAVVLVLAFFMEDLKTLAAFLTELARRSGVPSELFVPLYKTLGIALVVRFGSSLCRDAGETALGAVVETAGSVCALLAALPLLRAVLSLLLELME